MRQLTDERCEKEQGRRRDRIKDRAHYINISIVEGSMRALLGVGGMSGANVHWQAGQGDRERRGGEQGVGLGQRDPEGETGGRLDMERGETEREREASWVTADSLL